MKNLNRIYAIFTARNLEFLRDRSAFAWQFIFPILIVVGFAFSFNGDSSQKYTAGVFNLDFARENSLPFLKNNYVNFVDVSDLQAGLTKVERHALDILIDPVSGKYWLNDKSSKGYFLEKALMYQKEPDAYHKETLSGDPIRYIDWLIPGILGMNMMFSALWGIGFVIVRYRKNGVLKRLKATPVKSVEFLIAQLSSRIVIIMMNLSMLFWGLNFFFKFKMHGSHFDLFFVQFLGGICLISMGLIIAARIKNEEVASGLLNFFSMPMMFLSGLWFSMESAHPYLRTFSEILPLTQVTNLSRAIMLDGKTLWDFPLETGYLLVLSTLFLTVGSALFKWE